MKTNQNLGGLGFTLIELLVVVLIIGILASVALPQYEKAVRKARLSEVAATFNAISKGIDAWLLENDGYPADYVYFSGNGSGSSHAQLDIQQSCVTEGADACYTKLGRWSYACNENHCEIDLITELNADRTSGNKWLGAASIHWFKFGDNPWKLAGNLSATTKEICLWWKDMVGNNRVTDSYGGVSTACDAY